MQLLQEYFLLFVLYSFLGWCMETTLVSVQSKRFVDRGFLIGPCCPIYGFGALFIVLALGNFAYNPVILFVMSVISCGVLEYMTSWIMEVIFKARWWDYSNRKFNINGRICLENLLAFGVLGIMVNYIFNPFLMNLIYKLKNTQLLIISAIIAIIFIVDSIISFIVIFGFRKVTKTVNTQRKEDNTEQITSMVRQLFAEKSFFHRRFINAYPKLEAIKTKIKKIKIKIEDVTSDAKDVMVEKTGEIKSKIEEATNDAKDAINEKIERGTRKARVNLYLGKKQFKKFKGKKL